MEAGYYDYEVGTGNYDSGSVNHLHTWMPVHQLLTHDHGRGHGEHNKYMYYEAILVEVLDRQEYQQELENQEES